MTKVELVSEVFAPVKTVWNVLMEPAYVPKLYPNVITVEVDPPGRNRLGQKFHIVGRAGKRKLEIFSETVELIEEKRTVNRQLPGGLFKSFTQVVTLEDKGMGTMVRTTFEYEISMGYIGKLFNVVLLERLVTDNLKAYNSALKAICELIPLPE
ncbi:MAG: SRPBCC family protein [Thaumarchaeota archaeon]|nr:SRPBCC family protein [Nitrososphaerota archaeon]